MVFMPSTKCFRIEFLCFARICCPFGISWLSISKQSSNWLSWMVNLNLCNDFSWQLMSPIYLIIIVIRKSHFTFEIYHPFQNSFILLLNLKNHYSHFTSREEMFVRWLLFLNFGFTASLPRVVNNFSWHLSILEAVFLLPYRIPIW